MITGLVVSDNDIQNYNMDTEIYLSRQIWPRMIAGAAVVLILVTVVLGGVLGLQSRQKFVEIQSSWDTYSGAAARKGTLISALRAHLGFGGIIHNFKNYVLRQDRVFLVEARSQIGQFYAVVEEFKQLELEAEDKAALAAVLGTIRVYEARLDVATHAAGKGWSAAQIDTLVRVDDRAAIGALATLEANWEDTQLASRSRI